MINIKNIRKLYPDAKSAILKHPNIPHQPGDYCVGGALCNYLASVPKYSHIVTEYDPCGVYRRFPPSHILLYIIRKLNPKARNCDVVKIVSKNDRSKFDEAWYLLEQVVVEKK